MRNFHGFVAKTSCAALLSLTACLSWANENIKIPPWLKLDDTGRCQIGEMRINFEVTDGETGGGDSNGRCRFVSMVPTIELDCRIWRDEVRPFPNAPDFVARLDRKLSVLSGDTVNWKFSYEAPDTRKVIGTHISLVLPPAETLVLIDGKPFHIGKQYDKNLQFDGKCSRISIPAGGAEIEISGDLDLHFDDIRRYGCLGMLLCLHMQQTAPKWTKSELSFDVKYNGVKISKAAFDAMPKAFTPIPLDAVANNTTVDDKADDGVCGWTDKGPNDCPAAFNLKGRNALAGIPFDILDMSKGKNVVGVSHKALKLNLPDAIDIPMNGIKAGGLYFLHAGSWMSGRPGSYIVHYSDGSNTEIPLKKNESVFDWYTCGSSSQAEIGWKMPGAMFGFAVFPWTNPEPRKPIESISMKIAPDADKTVLLLLALTAVDGKPFLPEPEEPAPFDFSKWIPFIKYPTAAEIEGTALDVSAAVEAPAGKHGGVRVENGAFRFADGTNANFSGVVVSNSNGRWMQLSKEKLAETAKTLRQLGCNIIRVSGGLICFKNGSHKEFDPEKIDKACFFWNELKKNGVYVQLDLFDGFIINEDEIPGMGGSNWDKNLLASTSVQKLQKDYIKLILTYRNPYTGMTFGEDPELAMLMLVNEQSLLYQECLDNITNPVALKEFRDGFNGWLREKHRSRAALAAAWKGSLKASEDPAANTVELPMNYRKAGYSSERDRDIRAYLSEAEGRYFREETAAIRTAGCAAPITGNNHWTLDMLDFYEHAKNVDYFDRHSYWSHPVIEKSWSMADVLFTNEPSAGAADGGFLHQIISRRIVGMPYAQTEWDVGSTNEFRADAQIFLPAYASLHDWTLFHFEYTPESVMDRARKPFLDCPLSVSSDPLQLAMWPAGAQMFLRGDVKKADKVYYETVSYETALVGGSPKDLNKVVRAGLRGISGLNFNPDYKIPSDESLVPKDDDKIIESVTGELFWDTESGLCRIDTPKSQGYTGFAKGKKIACRAAGFDISTDFAAMLMTSRDNLDLDKSGSILLTATARCMNTGMRYNRLRNRFAAQGTAPVVFQPVEGTVSLKTKRELEVYALDFAGKRVKKLETRRDGDLLSVKLGDAIHYEFAAKP